MQEQTTDHDEAPPRIPFDVDLRILAIDVERVPWFASLLSTARKDFRPRDFAERHLVDQLAINQWRLLRVYGMEKAVYDHQLASFKGTSIQNPDGTETEPWDDYYRLAQAFSPDSDAVVLAALGRLETRFHRQFCSALRMLIALRRFNPLRDPELSTEALSTQKESAKCNPTPSATSSGTATTPSPNNSSPGSNP